MTIKEKKRLAWYKKYSAWNNKYGEKFRKALIIGDVTTLKTIPPPPPPPDDGE